VNIYFTFDYEIYFGQNHGTVDKCIIQPTNELIKIAEKHDVRFTFFVDIGFVIKLNEFKKQYPELEKDYKAITEQIKYLADTGHAVELHIHPHWEDSYYNGEKWIINLKRYKLADFNVEEINEIVCNYKNALINITSKSSYAYRAGGWCLQPFSKVKAAFLKYEIRLDSSVYKNGMFFSEQYSYDYTQAPDKDIYHFEDDLTLENKQGRFVELPITTVRNSPLFFWKLFALGRKNPYLHKPLGDGQAMAAPGYRKKLLTQFTYNPLSVDGYNAKLLQITLNKMVKKDKNHIVIIGHPKALSRFSLQKIEEFVENNKEKHKIVTVEHIIK